MRQVVLIPGLLCTRNIFSKLVTRHSQTLLSSTIDLVHADHTQFENMEEQASSILNHPSRSERFTLCGFSYGGYISLEILNQLQAVGELDRVEGLILISSQARADAEEVKQRRMKLIEIAEIKGIAAAVDEMAQLFLSWTDNEAEDVPEKHKGWLLEPEDPFMKSRPEHVLQDIKMMAEQLGVDVFRRQQLSIMSRSDRRDILQQVKCPVFIGCGDQDTMTPRASSLEMYRLCGSKDKLLKFFGPSAGHFAILETPNNVSRIISEWMSEKLV